MMKPISIVIITYNRPDDLMVLLRNLVSQMQASQLLEQILIINNASTISYESVMGFMQQHPEMPFEYVDSKENLGVARGRNAAISKARAPIIVTIDDDAWFQDSHALQSIVSQFESPFFKQESIGVLCFRVLYASTRHLQQNAFPHKKFEAYKDKSSFAAPYFIGCGHAIRKEVYDRVGLYPTDFFYGMEEYDLTYRILDAGYRIWYQDQITVLHNESPLGRTSPEQKWRMLWINKSKVAYRYLPKRFFYSTALMWSILYLYKTSMPIKTWMQGWKEIFKIPQEQKRTPIQSRTLKYLAQTEARLWY